MKNRGWIALALATLALAVLCAVLWQELKSSKARAIAAQRALEEEMAREMFGGENAGDKPPGGGEILPQPTK
jgi:hypothetical protein